MKNLYRIVSVTDKHGEADQDRIDAIKNICESMIGEVLYPEYVIPGNCFCLLWNNNSRRMMRTSPIESVESNNGKMKIITQNAIYELKILSNV